MDARQLARKALASTSPAVARQRLDEWREEWFAGWWQDMHQRRDYYEQVVQAAMPALTPASRDHLTQLWAAIKAYQNAETDQAREVADQEIERIVDVSPAVHRPVFDVLDQYPSPISDEELVRLANVAGVWTDENW